jgi:hypothetical protein
MRWALFFMMQPVKEMWRHVALGEGFAASRRLYLLVQSGQVALGGNSRLKIYGKLNCRSGRRMKPENRVFFSSERAALGHGYRPCAHCLPLAYQAWKQQQS